MAVDTKSHHFHRKVLGSNLAVDFVILYRYTNSSIYQPHILLVSF